MIKKSIRTVNASYERVVFSILNSINLYANKLASTKGSSNFSKNYFPSRSNFFIFSN